MSEPNFYPEDIIIGKSRNGRVRYGLIEKTVDMESDDESDSDMDDYSDNELEPGHVRLTWYPEGSEETVHESKIQLVDRSTLPRDVVHEMNGSQLGTVLDVDVHCDVAVVGTNKILKNIHCKSLKRIYPLMDGDLVAYGPWVGHISSAVGLLVLRFSNGARGKINLQDDSCEQLDDLYPHASDDGSFFDSEFYPGQVLSGPAKCFRKVLWFPGVPPPNLKSKSRFKVILEQLELAAVHVKWIQRAFSSPNERKKDDKPTSPSDKSKPDPTLSAELGAKTELTEYERKLCLSTNPAEPPPDVIHGEHLKYLKTLQYFWSGNLVLGTRMQYELTANDVEQLNLQPNNEKKLKRTRRVFSTRKMDRKMARMSDSASAIPPAKRKGDRKSSKSKETRNNQEDSEDDLSNTEDQNHDVNESWEDAADVAGGDQEQRCEDLDKDEEEKDDIDKFCYSTDPLPNSFACQMGQENRMKICPICPHFTIHGSCDSCEDKLGDFSLKFSVTGKEKQALNVNLENPNCSPEILKALSEGLEAEISPIRRSKFYWRGGISSNKMVAKLLKLLRKLSLQMNLLQDENIKYEYKVGENTVSGYMDNTGKQVELTFTGDSEQKTSDDGCESEVPNQGPSNETLNNWDGYRFTSGPIAQRQAGPKVIFQPGQNVTVEVVCTHTTADIEWQDGTMSRGIPSTGVRQAHHVDDNDFCPGDFVYDEANSGDVHLYGLILSADNANRMAIVQWFRLNTSTNKVTTLHKEEVSVYQVADHPDFHFRISDIIIRISSMSDEEHGEEQLIGELLRVNPNGKLQVLWSDGSQGEVYPQAVMQISSDEYDEEFHGSSSSGDASEAGSDESWETAASDVEDQDEVVVASVMEECIDAAVDAADHEEERDGLKEVEEEGRKESNKEDAGEEGCSAENEGGTFSQDESVPNSHGYIATECKQPGKKYTTALHKDLRLLRSALPSGIHVKSFEDRMDLFTILIEGPASTPYENGLFVFHAQLPWDYPSNPPNIRYISFSPRLNPNLYEDGKVCISLLGTWSGKGNEKWTDDSNLLQVLVSIQGLILNSEPYYNEAGYEGHRGTAEGKKNSRCYNEMVLLRLVQHMTMFVTTKHPTFTEFSLEYCRKHLPLLVRRVRSLLDWARQSYKESDGVTEKKKFNATEDINDNEVLGENDCVTATINSAQEEKLKKILDYPLLPLSKGVVIILQQELSKLIRAATRAGLFKE